MEEKVSVYKVKLGSSNHGLDEWHYRAEHRGSSGKPSDSIDILTEQIFKDLPPEMRSDVVFVTDSIKCVPAAYVSYSGQKVGAMFTQTAYLTDDELTTLMVSYGKILVKENLIASP